MTFPGRYSMYSVLFYIEPSKFSTPSDEIKKRLNPRAILDGPSRAHPHLNLNLADSLGYKQIEKNYFIIWATSRVPQRCLGNRQSPLEMFEHCDPEVPSRFVFIAK